MTRVAVVSLGRDAALGEVRRVLSWRLLLEAAGAEVHEIRLSPRHLPHLDGVAAVFAGRAAPERLAWSGRRLHEQLEGIGPAVVIVVSARAFDPRPIAGPWTVALDLVDSLSRSYRDRSEILTNRLARLEYRSLAAAHARVERQLRTSTVTRIAAGWADAQRLNAQWVPNVSDPALRPIGGARADRDVLFFGTLRYPPNVDALEHLARIWPTVQHARPGTTALIAGSGPTRRVHELCAEHEWELVGDFPALPEIAARARVAVAPLARTAGIQNKLLDAACLRIAQVVTPAALDGFAPGFPLEPRGSDHAFAAEIVRLLDHPDAAARQAAATAEYVLANYSVDTWRQWARDLMTGISAPPRAISAVGPSSNWRA